ncbi:MAG: hypothetical protein AUJ85_00895 [Elusimicrobia bacterium CG1_02_37_114]|nr:MAG: hypothetical protein AUJ85_00895 [Elusimicrobia bacterium CG1_02_37_114]PIV53071.1 MAG: DNA polymerase beta [Elusimicrobia bacterium CG02_land_8_20_14_3_00_37_13]PIZ12756.1 MAG: DNA polymerase beta [Elusimicrobia bacterium CG_4_10_14_0_8_um_filter_37_32]
MVENKVLEVINFLQHCLEEKKLDISKIILFGSQTKGNASRQSDMDVVIISKDFRKKNIFRRAELTKEAEIMTIKKFLVPLDIITLTPEELKSKTSLVSEYARNGKVVYAT